MAKSSEIGRTTIDPKVVMRLWGMSAGRCELCNKLLYIDSSFGDSANFAENAHIHAIGTMGPRHKNEMDRSEINQIDNLMLLCAEHHHLIDSKPENYLGDYLVRKKKEHEARIRSLTEIREDASCKMVTYFSNVDNVTVFSADDTLRRAVVHEKLYPKQGVPISLNEGSMTKYVPSKEIIEHQATALADQVRLNFQGLKKEESIAVFALAPQPLLIKLGTLICDQLDVHVFQCHREGEKWTWPEDSSSMDFLFKKTKESDGSILAFVIDLSTQIVDDRITSVLGSSCTIYHLTIENPSRSFVKNVGIQETFVQSFRMAMETLKKENPNCRTIHIFPAMPQSLAIRAGMDYMPKADLPIIIYEQAGPDIGFIETLMIGGKIDV